MIQVSILVVQIFIYHLIFYRYYDDLLDYLNVFFLFQKQLHS